MDASTLDAAVRAICPIVGVAIGDPDNRVTWRIDFDPAASDSQQAAALAKLQSIDMNATHVPQSVTNYQARAALIGANLFDQVDAVVTASTDKLVKAAWDYSTTISRTSPFITLLQGTVNLSDAQVDALFVAAAAIQS